VPQDIVHTPTVDPERFDESAELRVGTWVWVYTGEPDEDDGEIEGWMGCVTHVGSNYVAVEEPHSSRNSYRAERVHFDDVAEALEIEPDPEKVIAENAEACKERLEELLGEVRGLLETLGLKDRMLPAPGAAQTNALVLASKAPNVDGYKNALVKAKNESLPELFEKMENTSSNLVRWMSARALPMQAMAKQVKGVVGDIEDRVFTVELYAGLLEEVRLVRKGKPAGMGEKLRIMQRRCYMDEECLLGYRTGGIEIKDIRQFDRWLGRKANFERVLPYPRCMVAFRVRRHVKEREWDGTFAGAFIKVRLEQSDKLTFLYIRNGARLYRMNTAIEFGPTLFPDRGEYVLSEKMWAEVFAGNVKELVPDHEYQGMREDDAEKIRKYEQWEKDNPDKGWVHNPHMRPWGRTDRYQPYDPSSVYYDDIHKHVGDRIKEHNRIAVIVQGLLDRSEVLHPHPPTKTWTPEGFAAALELVYDSDRVLYAGEVPDFEAYRRGCNESLREGSVTIGQEDYWQRREAEKYNRSDRRYDKYHRDRTHYKPYGNPGPGFIARVGAWAPRARRATYRWERERQRWNRWGDNGPLLTKIAVPADKLLNVDAYEPGDFEQFFADPRTRAGYLKWAAMLLGAEEYHAGNLKVGSEGEGVPS
jgi:hypothetical protein